MQLLSIFVGVVAPVFAVVLIGYLAGPWLGLQVRTLSRVSYYVFMPGFVFHTISQARIQAAVVWRSLGAASGPRFVALTV